MGATDPAPTAARVGTNVTATIRAVGNGAGVDEYLSESAECRRRLDLHPEIPVLEWDSIDGGFCCNGAPFGGPLFMSAQLDKAASKFKQAVDVLRRLTRCSVQTRMLLLIKCVHAKPLHLLRGVPPAHGLDFARQVLQGSPQHLGPQLAILFFARGLHPQLLAGGHVLHCLCQECFHFIRRRQPGSLEPNVLAIEEVLTRLVEDVAGFLNLAI